MKEIVEKYFPPEYWANMQPREADVTKYYIMECMKDWLRLHEEQNKSAIKQPVINIFYQEDMD